MNPADIAARQAMMARLTGTPQPAITQISPQAGVQVPSPEVPAQNPSPQPDQQLGDMTRKPSERDKLAKSLLPGTADQDPHIRILAKAMLSKLIPYLGQ